MCYGEVLHFWLQRSTIWKNTLQVAQSKSMSIISEGADIIFASAEQYYRKSVVDIFLAPEAQYVYPFGVPSSLLKTIDFPSCENERVPLSSVGKLSSESLCFC